MGVDIKEHLRSAVAEPVLGVFDTGAVFRQATGMVVAEFMEGNVNARCLGDAFEFFGPAARVLQLTIWIGGIPGRYLPRAGRWPDGRLFAVPGVFHF